MTLPARNSDAFGTAPVCSAVVNGVLLIVTQRNRGADLVLIARGMRDGGLNPP
jgi:hypothetical protein